MGEITSLQDNYLINIIDQLIDGRNTDRDELEELISSDDIDRIITAANLKYPNITNQQFRQRIRELWEMNSFAKESTSFFDSIASGAKNLFSFGIQTQEQDRMDVDEAELENHLDSESDESIYERDMVRKGQLPTSQSSNNIQTQQMTQFTQDIDVMIKDESDTDVVSAPFNRLTPEDDHIFNKHHLVTASSNTRNRQAQQPKAVQDINIIRDDILVDPNDDSKPFWNGNAIIGFGNQLMQFEAIYEDQYLPFFYKWMSFANHDVNLFIKVLTDLPYLSGETATKISNTKCKWTLAWNLAHCKLPTEYHEYVDTYPYMIPDLVQFVKTNVSMPQFKNQMAIRKAGIKQRLKFHSKSNSIEDEANLLGLSTLTLDVEIFENLVAEYLEWKNAKPIAPPIDAGSSHMHSDYSRANDRPSKELKSVKKTQLKNTESTPVGKSSVKKAANNSTATFNKSFRKGSETILATIQRLSLRFPDMKLKEIGRIYFRCNYKEDRFLQYMSDKKNGIYRLTKVWKRLFQFGMQRMITS